MTFGGLSSNYLALRKRLSVYFDPHILAEITVEPPKGTRDELSFIRLVAWGYVLIYETGKIPLSFLKQLPPLDEHGKLLPYVRGLRTWTSHNLFFDKNHDLSTIREAVMWFKRTCGTGTPATAVHWGKCFEQLCQDLSSLLTKAISACDALHSEYDGPRLIEELKGRLDRHWDAYQFDSYVENARTRLGYSGLDIVAFRTKHLDSWRKIVAISEDGAIDRQLNLRIESDLLNTMAYALPLTSQELLKQFKLYGAPEITVVMLIMRELRNKEGMDMLTFLQEVSDRVRPQIKDIENL